MKRARLRIGKLSATVTGLVFLTSCTVVNTAVVPASARAPFMTTGDITQPYQSLGLLQVTRKGVLLFGFVDVVGTDIQTGFAEVLPPLVRERGGDGIINVRFDQSQYLPFTQVVFAILFFIPLPTHVTITGEVVKLLPQGGAPGAPAPR